MDLGFDDKPTILSVLMMFVVFLVAIFCDVKFLERYYLCHNRIDFTPTYAVERAVGFADFYCESFAATLYNCLEFLLALVAIDL